MNTAAMWLGFNIFIILLLAFDLGVLHKVKDAGCCASTVDEPVVLCAGPHVCGRYLLEPPESRKAWNF